MWRHQGPISCVAFAKSWPSKSIVVSGNAHARGTGDTGDTGMMVLGVTVACPGEDGVMLERAEAPSGELKVGGKC